MNVWIVNHYGGTPNSGRFERPVYTARAFASRGHQCTVFSAAFHHLLNEPVEVSEPRIEEIDGVTYVGLPTRSYGSNGVARVFNMLDSSRELWRFTNNLPDSVPAPDLVIASSPPPFLFAAAAKIRRHFGCPVVFEVRDLWPESLVQLAGVSAWHPFVLWLRQSARKAYRRADAVVSLLPAIHSYLEDIGVSNDKVHVITNGIDPEVFSSRSECELPEQHTALMSELRDKGKRIVLYTGAMGPPNALDQLLAMRPDGEVPWHLVLVGDGVARPGLEVLAREQNLGYVSFLPRVNKEQVPGLLQRADAAIISWNDAPLYQYGVSPNKVSEYLLAEKPVVWIGETGSNPVAESGAGFSVASNDPAALLGALSEMAALPADELAELGQRGRQHVLENYNWEKLGAAYEELAQRLVGRP